MSGEKRKADLQAAAHAYECTVMYIKLYFYVRIFCTGASWFGLWLLVRCGLWSGPCHYLVGVGAGVRLGSWGCM